MSDRLERAKKYEREWDTADIALTLVDAENDIASVTAQRDRLSAALEALVNAAGAECIPEANYPALSRAIKAARQALENA